MRPALIACALLVTPCLALADDSSLIDYTYVDARYIAADGDAFNVDSDGGQLEVSFGLGSYAYAIGSGLFAKTDDFATGAGDGNLEVIDGTAGLGLHLPLTPRLDAYAQAQYLFRSLDGDDALESINSFHDEGYATEVGLRGALLDNLEVTGGFDFRRIFETDQFSLVLDGEFKFTPNISVIGGVQQGDDIDLYSVGARFNF